MDERPFRVSKFVFIFSLFVFFASGFSFGAENLGKSAEGLLVPCASCHIDDAGKPNSIPEIKGMERAKLVAVMNSFRTQARTETMMHRLLKAYKEEEIKKIANALSKMKP